MYIMKKIIYISTIMKVYFNNSCKICKAEIDLYKKEEISEINWVDITNNKQAKIETKKKFQRTIKEIAC